MTFLEMPNTPGNVADKAYAVIALSFGGRGAEVTCINFEDITRKTDAETGEIHVMVKYQWKKKKGRT